jgi:hypothetical protein
MSPAITRIFDCEYCEKKIRVTHEHPNLIFGHHVQKCKAAKEEAFKEYRKKEKEKTRLAKQPALIQHTQRIENQIQEKNRKKQPVQEILPPADDLQEIESVLINMETIEDTLEGEPGRRTQFVQRALKITQIKPSKNRPKELIHLQEPTVISTEFFEKLDTIEEDDYGDYTPDPMRVSSSDTIHLESSEEEERPQYYTREEFNKQVERRAIEMLAKQRIKKQSYAPVVPTGVLEEEQENLERLQLMEDEQETYDEDGDLLDAEARELKKAEMIAQEGVIVRKGRAFTEIFKNFEQGIRSFMKYNKFDAIFHMYHVLVQSFVEWSGGFGLTDKKKQVFFEEIDEIDFTFQHLKGEQRGKKEYRDLRVFCERDLARRIYTAMWVVIFDTKAAREEAKNEFKLRLAENIGSDFGGGEDMARELMTDDDFGSQWNTDEE